MKQLLLFLCVIFSIDLCAQNDGAAFDNLVLKDSSIVPALFSYPDSVYNPILIASTYPQGFARLSEIQKTSSDSFKKLISNYRHPKQKRLWEITRYPELISTLIENKDKSEQELEEILKRYPTKIQNTAIHFLKNNYSTLVQVEAIQKDFETKYKEVIKDFPNNVKDAYASLLSYPELITMLWENLQTTVALGDLYKRNSSLLKQKADSLSNVIAKERGTEFENWKNGINKDTAMQKELQEIAKKYSEEETYDDDVYARADDRPEVAEPFDVAPYPLWAGYPDWYGRNYWYPYPWWAQMGLYWPLNGPVQFFGMPSYHFGWWYFNQPYGYYNRHPHTTDYFYRSYQGPRNFNSGLNQSTREFYNGRRQ